MTSEEEMICTRPDCNNRRSTKAKYCGLKCRKAAFKEAHGVITEMGNDTNIPLVRIKPKGCGHVKLGGRCLQKGCYGVPSK